MPGIMDELNKSLNLAGGMKGASSTDTGAEYNPQPSIPPESATAGRALQAPAQSVKPKASTSQVVSELLGGPSGVSEDEMLAMGIPKGGKQTSGGYMAPDGATYWKDAEGNWFMKPKGGGTTIPMGKYNKGPSSSENGPPAMGAWAGDKFYPSFGGGYVFQENPEGMAQAGGKNYSLMQEAPTWGNGSVGPSDQIDASAQGLAGAGAYGEASMPTGEGAGAAPELPTAAPDTGDYLDKMLVKLRDQYAKDYGYQPNLGELIGNALQTSGNRVVGSNAPTYLEQKQQRMQEQQMQHTAQDMGLIKNAMDFRYNSGLARLNAQLQANVITPAQYNMQSKLIQQQYVNDVNRFVNIVNAISKATGTNEALKPYLPGGLATLGINSAFANPLQFQTTPGIAGLETPTGQTVK